MTTKLNIQSSFQASAPAVAVIRGHAHVFGCLFYIMENGTEGVETPKGEQDNAKPQSGLEQNQEV